jgi:hypothetical protein
METSHPEVGIFETSAMDKGVTETFKVTTPDKIYFQGKLKSGALISYVAEGGDPFPGEPGLRWHIIGEKGEILITCPAFGMDIVHAGCAVKMIEYGERKIVHPMSHDKPKPTVIDVEIPKTPMDELNHPAQNVGRLYESYADGNTEGYSDWNVALERHELMQEMFQRWNTSKK